MFLVYLMNTRSAPLLPRFYIIMYMCIVRRAAAQREFVKRLQNHLCRDCTKSKENANKSCDKKRESEAKATSLKGNDRLLLDVYISISKSEQSRFVCSCVYTAWEYKFFQGPLPPKRPSFFLRNINECAKMDFFFRCR